MTPEEIMAARAKAAAAGDKEVVAYFDHQLAQAQEAARPPTPAEQHSVDLYRKLQGLIAEHGSPEQQDALQKQIQGETKADMEAQNRDTVEGMGTGGRLLAGAGRGAMGVTRQVGQLLSHVPGLEGLKIKPSEEESYETASKPLMDTAAGKVGNILGETGMTLPLTMGIGAGVGAGAKALNMARPLVQGGIEGGLAGGAQGALLAGEGNRGIGGAVGGLTGGALGTGTAGLMRYALPRAARAFGWSGGSPTGDVATPEATALAQQGIKLTSGQMAPKSQAALYEQAGSVGGKNAAMVRDARQRGMEGWQDRVLERARAPGSEAELSGNVSDKLDALHDEFSHAYDTLHQAPVAKPDEALDDISRLPEVVHDRTIPAKDSERAAVKDYLENAVTMVQPKSPQMAEAPIPGEPPAPLSTGAILQMRSGIRDERRAAFKANDYRMVRLWKNADDYLTGVLHDTAAPDVADQLRPLDTAYLHYKAVESAVGNSNMATEGFSPTHLVKALKEGTSKGNFARGNFGGLDDLGTLARQGVATLNQKVPPTGASLGILDTKNVPILGNTLEKMKLQSMVDHPERWIDTPGGPTPQSFSQDFLQRRQGLGAVGRRTLGQTILNQPTAE